MPISENPKGDAIQAAISSGNKTEAVALLKENVAEQVAIHQNLLVADDNLTVAMATEIEVTHAADRTPPASA
jgi:hypothetical protein